MINYCNTGKESSMDKLDVALNLMTPKQRRAWELRLSGLKQREIARKLGVSQQAVCKLLIGGKNRAKKELLV